MPPVVTDSSKRSRSCERGGETRSIPFGRPMIADAEKRAVLSVLDGPILTHGPLVKQFEHDFAAFSGADYAVATSSCAAALHLAACALGIGPGDEVLVAAQTHVATAHAITQCGARCVFVDCEPHTGNIDPDALEAAITGRTKGIALVHYAGIPASMKRIMKLARRHNLVVLEDCALAIGATIDGTHVGLFGDAGCFSFYPIKHITTIEGGMLITRRADIAERASLQRAFGIDRTPTGARPIPGDYEVPTLGFNYRLSETGAALGIEQLKRLPAFLVVRRRNFQALAFGLAGMDGVSVLNGLDAAAESGCYCLVLLLEDALRTRRVELIEALRARGVGTSIYYPKPVPCLAYYREVCTTRVTDYPNAARISDGSIALPVGPHVSSDDVSYMVAAVASSVKEVCSA